MAYLNDRVLDYGLNEIYTNGTRLDICNAEPTTFTEATVTYSIGNKTSLPVGAPQAGDPTGRRVIVSAFIDGTGTATDTGTYYAITDPVNSRLLAVAALASSIDIVDTEDFPVSQFEISIPGVS